MGPTVVIVVWTLCATDGAGGKKERGLPCCRTATATNLRITSPILLVLAACDAMRAARTMRRRPFLINRRGAEHPLLLSTSTRSRAGAHECAAFLTGRGSVTGGTFRSAGVSCRTIDVLNVSALASCRAKTWRSRARSLIAPGHAGVETR